MKPAVYAQHGRNEPLVHPNACNCQSSHSAPARAGTNGPTPLYRHDRSIARTPGAPPPPPKRLQPYTDAATGMFRGYAASPGCAPRPNRPCAKPPYPALLLRRARKACRAQIPQPRTLRRWRIYVHIRRGEECAHYAENSSARARENARSGASAHCKAFATATAASTNYFTTAGRRHARQKPVRPQLLDVGRLIRAFHDDTPSLTGE